ncbi:MAG: DUF1905 domain-containing protein [Rhodocyclaceae bacterium]|nr:MAG: DUF1905 domain-containing protein [Rhodocyclaceae bacterium]
MKQRFDAELVGRGPKGAWTFLPIPFNVQAVFGSKAGVPVAGTLNGFAFRNSLLPNGDGTHSMAVNKELQAWANAKAGDTVILSLAQCSSSSIEGYARSQAARGSAGWLVPPRPFMSNFADCEYRL